MHNAMSVDVEDYFQVSAFENTISPEQWDDLPGRVVSNTEKILDLFSTYSVQSTFFILGWVAERHPELVRDISNAGHEIASHGWSHKRISFLTENQFRDEVSRSKRLLEDLTGRDVLGYRAPSYSINKDNYWAFDILAEEGYRYSSSTVPIRHDLYGIPDSPRFPYMVSDGRLLEIPITTTRILGKNYPCGGGGWFRLYPYQLSRWAINRVNSKDQRSGVFYFHPWEIDPNQPRQNNISIKTKIRHYLNLSRTETRLERLLNDFEWTTMSELYLNGTDYG
ncbi:MAG: DUF3473 domain-containing protein [Candidatus Brocadiaceae bacterium]|nr:DUF3473 domain-containing protein [Candidatus Brocadiaceae bacterium]